MPLSHLLNCLFDILEWAND